MADYRIDDVARLAGTTVRNVRVYQDRGLLPPPRREGRVGWYSDAHLARLRLIGRLLERGYTFTSIGDLVTAWQSGRDLADVLGLEDVLTQPWIDEPAGHLSPGGLQAMFAGQAVPATVRRAVELGLLQRERGGFRVPSPALLAAGAELVQAGIPMPIVLDIAAAVGADLDAVAARFVEVFTEHLVGPRVEVEGLPASTDLRALAALIARLRPQASQAVVSLFGIAMERHSAAVFGETAERTAAPAPAPSPAAPPSAETAATMMSTSKGSKNQTHKNRGDRNDEGKDTSL